MPRRPAKSPTEQPLPFTYDDQPGEEVLTALGGVPLLLQAFRSLGVGASVKRNVAIKQRDRGLDEASYVESFVVLNAAGGECLDDFERLREDAGLASLVGHEMPSPEAARKFLYAFHDENKIVEAQQSLPVGQVSYIPGENAALPGAEDRHHRFRRHHHGKLEEGGAGDLPGRQGISAHAGSMGRSQRGGGG